MELLQWIENIDKELFTLINAEWAIQEADWFFKAMRNAGTWIILYAWLLYWIFTRCRTFAIHFLVFTLLCFAITDYTSASIIKPLAGRLRPCYDESLKETIRQLISCGGRYSMPSTHATNHFGLAAFWFLAVRHLTGKKWYWLWFWAAIIGYSQVYVGKHFPFDILAGAILGIIVAISLYFLFVYMIKRFVHNKNHKLPDGGKS
jgi:undecaprenyl-diphosphatase